MSFRDLLAGCAHPRWLDDGPDEMGDRTCAVCEQRVRVVLTEKAFKVTCNQLADRSRFPRPFPED